MGDLGYANSRFLGDLGYAELINRLLPPNIYDNSFTDS